MKHVQVIHCSVDQYTKIFSTSKNICKEKSIKLHYKERIAHQYATGKHRLELETPEAKHRKVDEAEQKQVTEEINSKFQKLDSKEPETFHLLRGKKQVLCLFCNTEINMFPERGSFEGNIQAHLCSSLHQSKKKQKSKQKSMHAFFKPLA